MRNYILQKKERSLAGKHSIGETKVGREMGKKSKKFSQLLTAKHVHTQKHTHANTKSKQWTTVNTMDGKIEVQ